MDAHENVVVPELASTPPPSLPPTGVPVQIAAAGTFAGIQSALSESQFDCAESAPAWWPVTTYPA
jgi:hypothetical protein